MTSHTPHGPPVLRTLVLVLLAVSLALTPPALAHGGVEHEEDDAQSGIHPTIQGYEDLGNLTAFWGDVALVDTGERLPVNPVAHGPWVVWEARDGPDTDLLAYNLEEDEAREVSVGPSDPFDPHVHDGRVVWGVSQGLEYHVLIHDLRNGTTWRLANSEDRVRNPVLGDDYLIWEVYRGANNWDILGHDLAAGTNFTVADTGFNEVDPLIVDDHVAWRVNEYGQWDIKVRDLDSGVERYVTRDKVRETRMRTDGDQLMWIPDEDGFIGRLYVHDPARSTTTVVGSFRDFGTPFQYHDGGIVSVGIFADNDTLFHHGLGPGDPQPLHEGRIDFRGEVALANGWLYTIVMVDGAQELLAYRPPWEQLAERPDIVIEEPTSGQLVLSNFTVRGRVSTLDAWGEPLNVYVSLDGGRSWDLARGITQWTLEANATDLNVGNHGIVVGATFASGPPVFGESVFTVARVLDVNEDFTSYTGTQSMPLWKAVATNIALVALLVLALVALVLVALRAYLRWSQQRSRPVQYVEPDEPEDNIRVAGRVDGPALDPDDGS